MSKLKVKVHESKMTAVMARAILGGAVEGDKEDARRNLNRLYSEWVVKFKTKDGSPYTMKIVGAEDENQAWKMALKFADQQRKGDLIDKTAPLNIDYIQKWESKVREASAIPDKTLHTVLANLKCLGKPGKAMQNYPLKRRRDLFDEMVKRGWLEPNSINLTSKGEEEAKNWIHLCQESKKSESEQVRWDDDFDMTSAAHDRLYNEIMKNPKGLTGGDAGYMLAEFVKDHKDLILAKFIQDVTLDLDHALYAVDNKYEWMEACFDRAVENM